MSKQCFVIIAAAWLLVSSQNQATAGQAIQPINLATSASGQSG